MAEAPLRTRAFAAEARERVDAPSDYNAAVLTGMSMSAEALTDAALAEHGNPPPPALAANRTLRRRLIVSLTVRLQGAAGLGLLERQELALLREAVDLFGSLGAYGVQRAVGAVVSSRAKLGWSSFGRTGEDVPLHAVGPGSERLRGSMDNSELGRRIERIMGWDLDKLTADLAPPAISQLDRDDPVTTGFASWP